MYKVVGQPETTAIRLNHKAADLQEMKAIALLQEPKADLVIHHHHQVAAVAVVVLPAVAVVHVHQEQEEVNQFKHTT